jgi:putative membrane protein
MLAQSGLFEIVEAVVAQVVSPELGAAYLGTQGDVWDAQNDMIAATVGAVLCMAILFFSMRSGRVRSIQEQRLRGRRGD